MMKMMIAPNTQIPIANGAIVMMIPVGMIPLRVLVKATLWSLLALTGNYFAAVKAVSSSVVLGVLGNRADSACVETDDLNGAAVCERILTGSCSVGADSDRGGVTLYIVCDDGICTRVSAGDGECEIEPFVLVSLITRDGFAEFKVVLSKSVGITRAFNTGILYIFAVCANVCCSITKNIAVNAEHIVIVRNYKNIQITCRV